MNMKTIYLCNESVAARRCTQNCRCKRLVNVNHVQEALVKIKQGKSDGNIGLTTDYLKHGFHKLCIYLSVLFSTMLSHGHAPKAMRLK